MNTVCLLVLMCDVVDSIFGSQAELKALLQSLGASAYLESLRTKGITTVPALGALVLEDLTEACSEIPQLLARAMIRAAAKQQVAPQAAEVTVKSMGVAAPTRKRYRKDFYNSEEGRRQRLDKSQSHNRCLLPLKDGARQRPRRRCAFCSSQTAVLCTACGVCLCDRPSKRCFDAFHEVDKIP